MSHRYSSMDPFPFRRAQPTTAKKEFTPIVKTHPEVLDIEVVGWKNVINFKSESIKFSSNEKRNDVNIANKM